LLEFEVVKTSVEGISFNFFDTIKEMRTFPRHSLISGSEVVNNFRRGDVLKLSLYTKDQVFVRVLKAVNLYRILLAFKFPICAVQKIDKLVRGVTTFLDIFASFSTHNFGQLTIEILERVSSKI
jgi:hypothetical protein